MLLKEILIQFPDLLGDQYTLRRVECLGFDINDVFDVLNEAIAKGRIRIDEGLVKIYFVKVYTDVLLVINDGPDLKQVENVGLPFFTAEVDGKFNFYRLVHIVLSDLEDKVKDLRQGKDVVLKDVGKGNQFFSFMEHAIPQYLVVEIIG